MQTHIDAVIMEYLDDMDSVYVFPSQIAAGLYAERTLLKSGRKAILRDKFIAWDFFLRQVFSKKQVEKESISEPLRKMFASKVLSENAKLKNIFTTIIHPEYASFSASFVSWVSKMLPELKTWGEKELKIPIENINEKTKNAARDSEAADYIELIIRYKKFLAENNLFESAWESPPFTPEGNHYILFFTEALSDFSVYQELFQSAPSRITIVRTPLEQEITETKFEKYLFKDAVSEVTASALYILNLRKNGVEYRYITVTSPDLESYEPYINAIFKNYGIPVQNGLGKPLAAYSAGRLFTSISKCAAKKMALSSLVELLLNRAIPWKSEEHINAIISYGTENNCICSWENEDGRFADVWELSFEKNPHHIRFFYRELKRAILLLTSQSSFEKTREQYFVFVDKFIDENKFHTEKFYEKSNAVLGRCISELSELIHIEKKYPKINLASPWSFFLEHLTSTIYKAQPESDGVSVFPYRVSASAPYACHIILGSNQSAMPQIFRKISFLSNVKRRALGSEDTDVSETFFNLHCFSSKKNAVFFFSQETFSGFTIPYSALNAVNDETKNLNTVLSENKNRFTPCLYEREAELFNALNAPDFSLDDAKQQDFFITQKQGFEFFSIRHKNTEIAPHVIDKKNKSVREFIERLYIKNGKIAVSASALLPYYKCALFWLLKNVFKVSDIDAETELMSPFAKGTLYHDIMSETFKEIKKQNLVLELQDDGTNFEIFKNILHESLEKTFMQLHKQKESALTENLLLSQNEIIEEKCLSLLSKMIKEFNFCTVTETEPDPEWTLETDMYVLRGRPDLLLREKECGNYIIIDFKSSKIPNKEDCTGGADGNVRNFQLPVYHILAEHNGFIPAGHGAFINIKDTEITLVFDPQDTKYKKVTFESVIEDVKNKIERYVREIKTSDFENSYNLNFSDCVKCDFKRVCRTTFTIQKGII